ncbi:hypothetical protein CP973_20750 [Streptomyces albofaciens JCM 4342]|nr:hypothetical protein CP973_20750 [Streptomyces albofaciens JCM 4342]
MRGTVRAGRRCEGERAAWFLCRLVAMGLRQSLVDDDRAAESVRNIVYVSNFAGLRTTFLDLYCKEGSHPYMELERMSNGVLSHSTVSRFVSGVTGRPSRQFVLASARVCGMRGVAPNEWARHGAGRRNADWKTRAELSAVTPSGTVSVEHQRMGAGAWMAFRRCTRHYRCPAGAGVLRQNLHTGLKGSVRRFGR